ncbi:transmembrane protein, putative [Rhizoctonia solani AG-3 Rhs1AP]|uniref:Transmembrane protein, putative n=1 Tax=Rhizoctonia solani AG-3 Rhs1AP TaxID=1086054 RepID=A0A0A1UM53_9AGAM|nr:transmembrane protein, putative [Rhizoctonia solani AG-3 Rhs1AP]
MSSFVRFAGFAAVILSLGLFATALPLLNAKIVACVGVDAVCEILNKLVVELSVEAKIKALLACGTIAELEVAVKVLIALFQGCADELLNIGADVVVEADAKLSIIACVASIITLLVHVLVQVCLKFGIAATVTLCAQIDVVVRLLLVNLNICIDGIVTLIVKALATVIVTLCAQVKLDLCVALFTKVGGLIA